MMSDGTRGHRGLGDQLLFKLKRFVRYIGLHRRVIVMPDGVRYRERSGVSVRRAISEFGPGVKEFDVRFPWMDAEGRRGMRIRYTAGRLYGDVGHDPRGVLYGQVLDELITPGFRVLEIGCGTGMGSSMLAQAVGPSGGVVAMDRDGESIRFARQRYQSDHCGFELGWIDTLDGETDGGFDAVFAVDPMRGAGNSPERARAIGEVVRVIEAGGWLVLVVSDPERLAALIDGFEALGMVHDRDLERCPRSGWSGCVYRKPGTRRAVVVREHTAPGPFQG